jgi:hypothetical protein
MIYNEPYKYLGTGDTRDLLEMLLKGVKWIRQFVREN